MERSQLIETIREQDLFDDGFYFDQVVAVGPEDFRADLTLIEHYLEIGVEWGLAPHPRPDAARQLREMATAKRANRPSSSSSGHDADAVDSLPPRVKALAFYLPQFHPIPENDRWWGAGFTEWTNVSRGRPKFSGHNQPRVPGELGFYDLRLPEVRAKQAELARSHGIHGFCYYYYWFAGRRLLERPLDEMLRSGAPDFPFCLCWANENWTRRWDGGANDILMAQEHSPELDIAFCDGLVPYFEDRRYIRVLERPMFVVYRPDILPEPKATLLRWREHLRRRGVGEVYIVAALTFGYHQGTEVGFDAEVQFPPHSFSIPERSRDYATNPDFSGSIFDYRDLAEKHMRHSAPGKKRFFSVMLEWDNTARKQGGGHVYENFGLAEYEQWLRCSVAKTEELYPADERFVFINAWNEWGEGTYLEPDLKRGRGCLEATQRALGGLDGMSLDDQIRLLDVFPPTSDAAIAARIARLAALLPEGEPTPTGVIAQLAPRKEVCVAAVEYPVVEETMVWIESIMVGEPLSETGLSLTGWAISKQTPPATVEISVQHRLLIETPISRLREDVYKYHDDVEYHRAPNSFSATVSRDVILDHARGTGAPVIHLTVVGRDGTELSRVAIKIDIVAKASPLTRLMSSPLESLDAGARELQTRLLRYAEALSPTGLAPAVERDRPEDQPPEVEGAIDMLTRAKADGWAWAPSAPEQALQIEAVLGGRVIGRTLADRMRPDLLQYGKGTGLYGFSMTFEAPVQGEEAPRLRVLAAMGSALPGPTSLPPITAADKEVRARGTIVTLLAEHDRFTSKGPEFEDLDPGILAPVESAAPGIPRPLLLAFYLPQFHAIPENDRFWGTGFTEWRQLARGMSRFPGHYQPRTPRDLGFYDLESLDAARAQTEMAKAAGVNAFAYYYYWFNGRRVLEKPLDRLIASDVDMPFLLIWANENWTRTWDGYEADILLKQDYDPKDDDALVDDIAGYFEDPRYVRVGGRPLFVIYNPGNIPDAADTIARWRHGFASRYLLDPLIFMAQTFGKADPTPYGLDGAMEFPPHKLSNKLPGRTTPDAYSTDFAGRVIAYDDFVNASLADYDPPFPLIKTIVPSWDNDVRRPNKGLTLEGSSPNKYQAWLEELIKRAIDKPIFGAPIVAINAWNEWAESAYLEPDVHFGSAYLNATARAVVAAMSAIHAERSRPTVVAADPIRVSVVFPNYKHAKYLPERIGSVLEQTVPPDEIIFLDDASDDDSVEIARTLLSASPIPFRIEVNAKNSGCVFRQWLKGIALAKHDIIWIAETDDSADRHFLQYALAGFAREDVMACFGRIVCIDPTGAYRHDLDNYFDGLQDFSWNASRIVSAHRAFSRDFAIKNVIPNASGLLFRKPILSEAEVERLYEYRFAGDWYFYALVARGGAIAYDRRANSLFRVNPSSASRSSFFTDRHLAEHRMIVQDLSRQYDIGGDAIDAHADALAVHFPDRSRDDIRNALEPAVDTRARAPMRVCIAANGFSVGGGEVLPLELANEMKARGLHVTYLVVERAADPHGSIRSRLRSDIPVVYWDDICDRFGDFIRDYGIELINSHNVSFDYRVFLRRIKFDIPYVASLHGGYETVPDLHTPDFLDYLATTLSKWLYLAKRNVAFLPPDREISHNFLRSFNAVPAYRGEWIDRREFRARHAIPADAFVFVLCSRAIEAKGWRTAIEITEKLASETARPIRLVLIGDGPLAAELKAEYQTSPLVVFLGQIDTPLRYFKCFDVGIFPSTFVGETFPLFLLECFQAGLPVISTDIGEIRAMMEGDPPRPPGILVDHRCEAPILKWRFVTKLRRMLDAPADYERYRQGAVAASQRFSMGSLGDLYEEAFCDLVAGDAKRRPQKFPSFPIEIASTDSAGKIARM